MSNDLISRKSVIDILESIMLNDSNLSKRYMAADIRDKVNELPTDYDVDAVCDELEKMKEIMLSPINIDCFGDTCRESDCMACILNRAIEIVRNGGKKE